MELITQDELDKAQIKCRVLYRPVLIARDGTFLMYDVGGIHGFTEFLQTINPDLDSLDIGQTGKEGVFGMDKRTGMGKR